jgi:hypothetical protein
MKEWFDWHAETIAARTVKALEKNNFSAFYVPDKQAAIEKALSLVPHGASAGFGGSWTMKQLGIASALAEKGHEVFDHNQPGLSFEDSIAIRKKQLSCDAFFSSANAITMDGQLVNVDAVGNRVGAMMFGPRQVIIISSVGKIVPDLEAAVKRIKNYVAPINNKRLARPNPCVQTGICMDCQLPTRTCNITTILHKKPAAIAFTVILVGEDLGF